MEHSEAVALGRRIDKETGYEMQVDSVHIDPRGRYVCMFRGPGQYINFYSEQEWTHYKEQAGWQEQMQWRPQPGGEQQ